MRIDYESCRYVIFPSIVTFLLDPNTVNRLFSNTYKQYIPLTSDKMYNADELLFCIF
jgi:hypothetical protein